MDRKTETIRANMENALAIIGTSVVRIEDARRVVLQVRNPSTTAFMQAELAEISNSLQKSQGIICLAMNQLIGREE
jgi:hypothetical protein